ncbi:hypothetical protein BGZ57DRAFT_982508 [Hyaloscypha finlandica]|nr:hypothetical protein BGZ57DRAFT_982508 [Hyaloscypha finlandica]
MMFILAVSILLAISPSAKAIPALGFSPTDTNPLGQPFVNAVLPVQPGFSPRFNLFRRQGCPNLTLLCPSGGCCSYDTSCCGRGTVDAPCCVAVNSPTNKCGGSNGNTRRSSVQWNQYLLSSNNHCYYDSSNIARCSPLSPSPLPPTTTPITTSSDTPITSPIPIPVTTSTKPVTTTTPYPYPSYSSSSTTILPSYFSTFWTPAAIGSVAGGSAGGVILLAILICVCIRCRRSHSDPIPDLSAKPLTNGEIYCVVQGLTTTQEWQEAYITKAKRTRAGQHLDRASWMKDFGTRAVELRVQQIRDGGERNKSMWKAGAISFVPFVKYLGWFRDSIKRFNRVAIDALGMGDSADIKVLCKGAKAAADKSTLLAKLQPGIEWVGKHALKEWLSHSDAHSDLVGLDINLFDDFKAETLKLGDNFVLMCGRLDRGFFESIGDNLLQLFDTSGLIVDGFYDCTQLVFDFGYDILLQASDVGGLGVD